MSAPLVHCVIVRPGLDRGMLAAQVLHAAAESADGLHDARTHALALEARSEEELLAMLAEVRARGLRGVEGVEDDPPWSGVLMAIGISPTAKDNLNFLRHLPLIKTRPGSSEKEHCFTAEVAGSSPARGPTVAEATPPTRGGGMAISPGS